jgi:hypothetical protein
MWVVVINPVSGSGKGAILGTEDSRFFLGEKIVLSNHYSDICR